MTSIPLIIHQIYEGRDGTSPNEMLIRLAKTWVEKNPLFEYRFWSYKKIDRFLTGFYPGFIDTYNNFRYDVQRWDAIRYLILYHYGGVYADIDYECLKPIEALLENQNCCFGMEPQQHSKVYKRDYVVGNAFMAVVPKHPVFKKILDRISNTNSNSPDKFNYVLETTGPFMLSDLYKSYPDKRSISPIPSELVAPLSIKEIVKVTKGKTTKQISEKMEKAYAVHYFFGSCCEK